MKALTIHKKVITKLVEEHVNKWFLDKIDSTLKNFITEQSDLNFLP